MAGRFPSEKNNALINYLLIILAFALIVFAICVFFKFKINAIEKGNTSAWQTNEKTYLEKNQSAS